MILWILWIIAFFLIEGYAIKTNKYDTLSEKIWKVQKKHWVFRLIAFVVIIWAGIHLLGYECALGIC